MQPNFKTLQITYHYDALNRLVASTPSVQATAQRFYLKDQLTTETQGSAQHSIMQYHEQLLALQQRQNGTAMETSFFATDQQRSVLTMLDAKRIHAFTYMPYGHCILEGGLLGFLGFNGERSDPVTGHYLLGNGYRALNPVLMRFNSPDSWSPFGKGGLNAYAYCQGNPINRSDPTGHMLRLKSIFTKTKNLTPTIAGPAKNSGNIKNITRINEDLHTFENNDGSKLTIVTHGNKQTKQLFSAGKLWTADDIITKTNLKTYDRVRILACHSDEIGAEIAIKTGKKVKAYIGEVTTNLSGEILDKMYYLRKDTKNPNAGDFTVKIDKEKPDYQPVKFMP